MARMLGSDAILRSLEHEGVEVAFGIPGGAILPTYDAIARGTSVRHVLARHEQGAGHMAEGYARASGRVGVAIATSGPGATNLVTPIADAWMDSTPLVAITGQVRSNLIGTDAFQEIDATGITMPIVKHSWLVQDVEELPAIMKAAFHVARTGLREAWEGGNGTSYTNSPLRDLQQVNGHWRAVVGERAVDAGSVVLAAGGRCYAEAGHRGELSTNHPNATGEVTKIALELGAASRDLDALQYHPNGGAWPPNMQGYSIPETTRAYGAVLLNAEGEEFTDSLGPRDAVSQAIVDEVEAGRGVTTPDGRAAVYLDTTRIALADAEISLPYMLRRYRGAGIDPLREKIFTYPVLHYQNGGLVIDTTGETTLEGVYACGEIAGGTHGRNRMMGNSLLECVVFGRRAGKAAADKAKA